MDKLIVNTVGIVLIGAIYWFFFGKKDEAIETGDAITIVVDGGYAPNTIKVKQGRPVRLTFIRKDPNTCLEEIVFPDYKIKNYLPLNTPVAITLSPPHSGKSGFHCSMNMYHGRIEISG